MFIVRILHNLIFINYLFILCIFVSYRLLKRKTKINIKFNHVIRIRTEKIKTTNYHIVFWYHIRN